MDSTACLVESDAPYIDLSLDPRPIGQRDMEEDNPISRHLKLQVSFVAARPCFFGLREQRAHTRMRHVSLNRNVRPRDGLAGGIGQLESDRSGTDAGRFRREFVLNREKGPRLDRSRTTGYKQSRSADEPVEN